MIARRSAVVAALAAMLLLMGIGGAGADTITADIITPATVDVSLGKGSSTTVDATLSLTEAPQQADVLLAFDTTGSMGGAITNAQADASDIVSGIKQAIPNARFAVADFKDYPTAPLGSAGDYPWRVVQDFTTNSTPITCPLGADSPTLLPFQCALQKLGASGGSDGPEAYNRAFYEAAHDSNHLQWASGSPRFMVVLGDSVPHDTQIATQFPACANTGVTDPGSAFTAPAGVSYGAVAYPDVGPLATEPQLAALKAAATHTNVSFVTYNPSPSTSGCHKQMAEYTGGTEVTHEVGTVALKTQIVDLVKQAAKHVDNVEFEVHRTDENPGPEPVLTFTPPKLGPLLTPADTDYEMTVTVPATTPVGTFGFRVFAVADGAYRGQQDVTVHVSNRSISSLTLTADQASVPAGIASAPYASIPAARLATLTPDVASAPAGSIPAGSIPAGSIPAGSIPAGSIPAGSIPAGSIPAGSIPAGSIGFGTTPAGSIPAGSIPIPGATPAGSIPAGSIPAGSIALRSVLLSQIPLVETTWAQILRGSPFENQPLQAVTLYDIANYSSTLPFPRAEADQTPWERLMSLPLRDVPFLTTLWRSIPFSALMLGNATLDQLQNAVPRRPDGTPYASWQEAITQNGGSFTGVSSSTNTVFGVAIAGQLGSTPAGSIPAGSIPAGSIPAGSIPAGSIDIGQTLLRSVPIIEITPALGKAQEDYVNCSGSVGNFTCPAGSTIGQADAVGALNPTLTLDALFASLPAGSIGRQTTIDQIIQAMLPLSDYPWEQIKLQGLQDVVGTGQNVRYHADFDLACSLATRSQLTVQLPDGFFVKPGTSQVSYAGGAAQAIADPTGQAGSPRWVPPGPCAETSATRHVRLDFTAFAGLTLGSQSSSASVTALNGELGVGTYTQGGQAPVLVTQNFEPSDDAATAPVIAKDTLVVGHIASANDVDYYRFSLSPLAPGTKVAAYLKTAPGTDLDLALNKPGAPTIQPSPAGSIPAGSIGIEDSGPGVDNSRGALPPDTLADVPAGSIPAGSIPAGSIPAGSISANRGAVNEAVQIVTHGESGNAIVGVSGYNSAFSNGNYVLRLKVTPPPTLPTCPAVTGLAPTLATPSTLPTSLPSDTTALFLVNRQRLAGMYGVNRMNDLLNAPDFATVRSQVKVKGQIIPVDGSTAVRNAYAAWDSSAGQCSVDAANAVVTAINGVVAGYRTSLPNLKYVVLLGTDQALPSWRLSDLATLSPEVDNAQELAFTTANLTEGNPTYAASALNTVLTDGAYGNFRRVPFLGHDLPLAQVAVSRVVETPEDIIGQFHQYVATSGQLNVQSALTTGDDFFVDGALDASTALANQFGTGLANDSLFPPTALWTKDDLATHFFNGTVPGVGALYAHYNHWLLQPAGLPTSFGLTDFPTSADVRQAQLVFTIGCHSGLSVPDTVGAPIATADAARQADWAQAYGHSNTAVYVANTGFGYGDTKTVDLSERLMRNFARNLNTGGTIGEQWVRALHEYYATAGTYDVVDEKVMVEANMYGLPFYGFSNGAQTPPPTAAPLTPQQVGSLNLAQVPPITATITAHDAGNGESLFYDGSQPDGTTNASGIKSGTLSVIYRPVQPQLSRDVTVPGTSAHGAYITALATHTFGGVTPVKPFPLVFDPSERPQTDYGSIFFPAGLVTVNRDVVFGQERSTLVVNMGRFRPDPGSNSGTEQLVDSIGVDIGYSNSSDVAAPQISQVGAVKTGAGTFTAFVRVSDDAGAPSRVAVLWTEGTTWQVQALTNQGAGLWTGQISSSASQIVLDGEAQDAAGNVGFSFNKAVNFQSVPDTTGPSLLVSQPLPDGVYTLNQQVATSFDCSDLGGTASCTGASETGPTIQSGGLLDTSSVGSHTFTVTGTDLSGHPNVKSVTYRVVFGFSGFRPPISNPPVLNVDNAGRTIPVKWGLKNAAGVAYSSLDAVRSIWSTGIRCPNATSTTVTGDVPIGVSGLKITGGDFQFNWATDKGWAGSCRRLYIRLSDGTTPYAEFQFK